MGGFLNILDNGDRDRVSEAASAIDLFACS